MSHTKNTGSELPVIKILGQELEETLKLLHELSDKDYSHKYYDLGVEAPIEGSIGEHTRHALEHIFAVLDAIPELKKEDSALPCICYDRRERNATLEKERLLCIERIEGCMEYIQSLEKVGIEDLLRRKIKVEHMIDAKGNYAFFLSNLERECMFVSHHLVHHKALIAIKLRLLKRPLDSAFGIAPATKNLLQRA